MNKFQDFILQHHKVALSYESLVQGEAFARNRFNGLDLGHTNKDISAYYRDKAKSRLTTDITVNETTGIVTKNAAKQFAVIAGLFKRQSAMACNKSAVAPTEDLTTGM